MSNNKNLIIHVGAPRTGTSFLRKEVFPRIRGVTFHNKQVVTNSITSYFSELSHYGDGDELSISANNLRKPDLTGSKNKILVSEEHLLWSVYHLFGNAGSRALMLKRRFPDAKIILTIRRQPEYILSTYSYLKSLKRKEDISHLRSLWRFANYAPKIEILKCKKVIGIPLGLQWDKVFSTYDTGKNYFDRRARHFIAADFSWLSLYAIYSQLFGVKNILVLPQEIWGTEPLKGVSLLENFVGEQVNSDRINFRHKVNVRKISVRCEDPGISDFVDFVQSLVWRDNIKLANTVDYCDLTALGYTEEKTARRKNISIGLGKPEAVQDERFQRACTILCQRVARTGLIHTATTIVPMLAVQLVRHAKLRQRFYRVRKGLADRLKGLDFESIESVEGLSLDPATSNQYEGSKTDDLEELFNKIELPETVRFLDFGSGKGRVVCYVASLNNVEVSRGIEISERLCNIAAKNISVIGFENCEIINDDVRDVSESLIDDTNVFYFYNPFPRSVLAEVLEKVAGSVKKRDSEILIIYFNPVDGDLVEANFEGRFRRIDYKNRISTAITSVYWIEQPHA